MMSSLMIIDGDNDKNGQTMTMTMTGIKMKMKMMIFIRKLAVHAPGDSFPLERGAEGRHLWTCLSTEFTRGDEDEEDDDDDDDDVDDATKYTSRHVGAHLHLKTYYSIFLLLDDETLPILFLLSIAKLDCILNSVHQSFQHWDGIGNSQSEILSKSLNFRDHPQFRSAGPKEGFSYSNVLTKLVFRCQISFHVDQSDPNFNKI